MYDEYLSDLTVKRISNEDKIKLQEPIGLDEISETLMKMKNGTSPGSDGFPVEFYNFFWND